MQSSGLHLTRRSLYRACGEVLTLMVEQRFATQGLVVVQGYGSTESSPGYTILNDQDAKQHRGSVGKLLPNMAARLVDDEDKDVDEGERGELWIKGPNIMKSVGCGCRKASSSLVNAYPANSARGYLRNPAATETTVTSDGWYKTGDIVTISPEGIIRIVDRKKELIKYKGLQIAPAELEAVLFGHAEVADVGVVGMWDEKEQTELPRSVHCALRPVKMYAQTLRRAYIVPTKGLKAFATHQDRSKVADRIHAWMRPKVAHYKRLTGGIVLTEDFPRL